MSLQSTRIRHHRRMTLNLFRAIYLQQLLHLLLLKHEKKGLSLFRFLLSHINLNGVNHYPFGMFSFMPGINV